MKLNYYLHVKHVKINLDKIQIIRYNYIRKNERGPKIYEKLSV